MEYQYGKEKNGMYIDEHECEDVVKYRKEVFVGCATVTLHYLSAVHRVQTVHTALGLCVLP